MADQRDILRILRWASEKRSNNSSGNMDMAAVEDNTFSRKKVTKEAGNGSGNMDIVAVEGGSGKKARVVAQAAPSITVTMNSNLLECCVCWGPLIPPLFQCSNGHITSSECHNPMVLQCSRCWPEAEADAITRCRAIERFVGGLTVPCSFQEHGCTKMVPYEGMAEHEKLCPHAVSFCPVPGCRLRRYAGMSLLEHLDAEHQGITRTRVPAASVRALQMHEGETAHLVFLDGGGDHEEEYRPVFLLVADEVLLPTPECALSVFRITTGPFQEDVYMYKIQVHCRTGAILSLSGGARSVERLTKPYAARVPLTISAAMWSPKDSPVYIEIKEIKPPLIHASIPPSSSIHRP